MDISDKNFRAESITAYAYQIIGFTPTFKEFVFAMLDFTGQPDPIIIDTYIELSQKDFPQHVVLDTYFIKYMSHADLVALMWAWYSELERKTNMSKEEEAKKAIKADIDELHRRIREFRSSKKFNDMLKFTARFHYLAPYNAMLVSLQKAGADFVLSISNWEKLGRRPVLNGQQLITLALFGPVQIMFDYSDTEAIPDWIPPHGAGYRTALTKTQLMGEWENMLDRANRGKWSKSRDPWGRILDNLPRYGIAYHDDFNAAGGFGGYLERGYDKENLTITIGRGEDSVDFTERSRFLININTHLRPDSQFHTLCHELGHLFCRHLFYDPKKVRSLTLKEKEFEAETVAWLVCNRSGIENPSETYLATYSTDGMLPEYDLTLIMTAVTEIEKMIHGIVSVKETIWYKNDDKFKSSADVALKEYAEKVAARKAAEAKKAAKSDSESNNQ